MKISLSLSLLVLLAACGESRIQSVDDKVLDKANADQATAAARLAESTLLGDWRLCEEGEDGASTRYDYTFGTEGKTRIVATAYSGAQCTGENPVVTAVTGTWKLLPVADTSDFTLELRWADGKKLTSEYSSSGMEATLPNLIQLKDETDLKLIPLKDKDRFLSLNKIQPSAIDDSTSVAEKMLIDYAQGLIARKGSWQSRCESSRNVILSFAAGQTTKVTATENTYEDTACKTLKEVTAKTTSDFSIVSVQSLSKKLLSVKIGTEDQVLKVGFSNVDRLDLDSVTFAFVGANP